VELQKPTPLLNLALGFKTLIRSRYSTSCVFFSPWSHRFESAGPLCSRRYLCTFNARCLELSPPSFPLVLSAVPCTSASSLLNTSVAYAFLIATGSLSVSVTFLPGPPHFSQRNVPLCRKKNFQSLIRYPSRGIFPETFLSINSFSALPR